MMNYLISSNAPHMVQTKKAQLSFREFADCLKSLYYVYIKDKTEESSCFVEGSLSLILRVDDEPFNENFFVQLLNLFAEKRINPIVVLQFYELPAYEDAKFISKSGDTFRLTYERNCLVTFLNRKYNMLICSFVIAADKLIVLKIGSSNNNFVLLSSQLIPAETCRYEYLAWSKALMEQYQKAMLLAKFAKDSHE